MILAINSYKIVSESSKKDAFSGTTYMGVHPTPTPPKGPEHYFFKKIRKIGFLKVFGPHFHWILAIISYKIVPESSKKDAFSGTTYKGVHPTPTRVAASVRNGQAKQSKAKWHFQKVKAKQNKAKQSLLLAFF